MGLAKALIVTYALAGVVTIGSFKSAAWNERICPALDGSTCFQPQNVRSDSFYNMFARYEKGTNDEEIREALDGFAVFLEYNPSYRADIIAYGGRRSCRGEARKRAQLAMKYLTNEKGIAAERVAIRDGGYRDKWAVELWKGVDGATRPSSMLTIDRNKVTILKNCHSTRNEHHTSR